MGLVVRGKQKRRQPVALDAGHRGELPAQQRLQVKLLLEPYRHGRQKRAKAPRRISDVRLEQALEFEQRLVVENDVIDVFEADAGFAQTVLDGAARKAGVVLAAREALLLGGGRDPAVDDQCRSTVVIEGGDAENAHVRNRYGTARCVAA